MAWPDLSESWCPWCECVVAQPRLTRWHDDGCEYQCPLCGETHVRKEGDEGIFIFFPGDIAAATSQEIESVFGDWGEEQSSPPPDE
jgi:hypothetical protein